MENVFSGVGLSLLWISSVWSLRLSLDCLTVDCSVHYQPRCCSSHHQAVGRSLKPLANWRFGSIFRNSIPPVRWVLTSQIWLKSHLVIAGHTKCQHLRRSLRWITPPLLRLLSMSSSTSNLETAAQLELLEVTATTWWLSPANSVRLSWVKITGTLRLSPLPAATSTCTMTSSASLACQPAPHRPMKNWGNKNCWSWPSRNCWRSRDSRPSE